MDEREASVASSTDFYESDGKPDTPLRDGPDAHNEGSPAKRKAEHQPVIQEKRRKIDSPAPPATTHVNPCAGLSPAIWQHIFLFCSVQELGRLFQVNRSFRSYLSDVRHVSPTKPASGFVRLLKSESIWASARNRHPTKPPKPLPGFSEVQMWQLVWNKTCQFCGRNNTYIPGEKIWQKGPGATGVRVVWPFSIRSCGPCLLQKCQTDASLLFSTASALRPALPYAFITNEQHYIPAYTLQAATTPANVEIVKYYYKDHVGEITKELNDALARGSAAAEEWSKGLESRGEGSLKVAETWERWEVKYHWWRDHQESKQAPLPSHTALPQQQVTRSPPRSAQSPIIHAPVPATTLPQYFTPAPHSMQHRPPTIPPSAFTPQPGPGTLPPSNRTERNLADANEAKASRKLDIERRCQQLQPPIPPNVLRHMESFKAAIVISRPLNESDWGMLQPRLFAQLPAAQQAEIDHTARLASLTTRAADRRQQDVSLKEVKEVLDREWEEAQRPIREKLCAIADDFIRNDWDNGQAVTFENSPKFAVDLLKHVRSKFYAAEGESSPQGQHDLDTQQNHDQGPRLVLENMKWVYDNKLKPLTEHFRKELFLCIVCEANSKFYGFEGVVQHYGAKHTNQFSVGNVVVAWKEAEWPEDTPFHPDPISVKHTFHPSAAGQGSGYGNYYGGYSRAGTATPHGQTHMPQASPGPYHYGGHYNGPFAPPQVAPGYNYSNGYGVSMDPFPQYQSLGNSGFGPQMSNSGYMASPAMHAAALGVTPAGLQPSHGYAEASEVDHRTSLFDKEVSTVIEIAQDIWKQTSGIKDLSNSLRVYVLLQRVISKFQIGFNHDPTLAHFIDAFQNHQIPKALKNAPGLSCKACQNELSHRSATAHSSAEERKTYTALNLFIHFQSLNAHQPQGYGTDPPSSHLDWKEDMVELPSDRFISGLIHALGMDDDKLHMIATVFPKLFPTPLPKIGLVDHGITSPADSSSKDPKDMAGTGVTPGLSTEKSGPSSLASPFTDSPRPPKPTEDEYDPQRPALAPQGSDAAIGGSRRRAYRPSPPSSDHRQRYYAQPQYYLTRDPMEEDHPTSRGFLEIAPTPRRIRDTGIPYEEHQGRRPIYPEHEEIYYDFHHEEPPYGTSSRDQRRDHELVSHAHRHVRYVEDEDNHRPALRVVRRSQELGAPIEEHGPGLSSDIRASGHDGSTHLPPKPPAAETDPEDGSRYTPPPPNSATVGDHLDPGNSFPGASHHVAPSTVSNSSRHEDRPGRHVPTPDSVTGSRRNGPFRRRERHNDHVPARYYRYMSVAHDEPASRGPSMGRSQSRRYERYEEQRRRIDQQETPQSNAERDYDPAFSRDQSMDRGLPDDSYQPPVRLGPREYIPIQDRLQPNSPPRLRYASDDTRGAPPVFYDDLGQHVQEYEIIRLPREHRRTYVQQGRYYPEHENGHIEYVSYQRPPPPREYVYYEGRPSSSRRPVFEPEREPSFQPPPDIKVEGASGSERP